MKPSWEMVERRAGCRMGTRVGTRAYLWFVLFAALFYLRRYFLPRRAVNEAPALQACCPCEEGSNLEMGPC